MLKSLYTMGYTLIQYYRGKSTWQLQYYRGKSTWKEYMATKSALSQKIFIKKINTKSEAKLVTSRAAGVWKSLPYGVTFI